MTSDDITTDDLFACARGERLAGLGLELTRKCNYRCTYCYANAGKRLPCELTLREIRLVIDEAVTLGVKRVGVIGGGEPFLHPEIMAVLRHLFGRGVHVSLFTNGSKMTRGLARYLFDHGASVVQKFNGTDQRTNELVTRNKSSFADSQRSIDHLLAAGFPSKRSRLTVETVVLKENRTQIPEIWRLARRNGWDVMVERVTPIGRAVHVPFLCSSKEVQALFEMLSNIDRKEFERDWIPRPPIAGPDGCKNILYSLYVRSDGVLQPCSGTAVGLGRVGETTLSEAIRTDAMITLRNIRQHIKGKCASCALVDRCYGCRAAALAIHKDYLAEDPYCWRVVDQ